MTPKRHLSFAHERVSSWPDETQFAPFVLVLRGGAGRIPTKRGFPVVTAQAISLAREQKAVTLIRGLKYVGGGRYNIGADEKRTQIGSTFRFQDATMMERYRIRVTTAMGADRRPRRNRGERA
jgi:hypothetical protein